MFRRSLSERFIAMRGIVFPHNDLDKAFLGTFRKTSRDSEKYLACLGKDQLHRPSYKPEDLAEE
jgi:hypothetical protein